MRFFGHGFDSMMWIEDAHISTLHTFAHAMFIRAYSELFFTHVHVLVFVSLCSLFVSHFVNSVARAHNIPLSLSFLFSVMLFIVMLFCFVVAARREPFCRLMGIRRPTPQI